MDRDAKINNEKIFRFPYFNTSFEYQKIKLEEEKAKIANKIANNPATHNVISGRGILHDERAFNKMFNTVVNINKYQKQLKNRKKILATNTNTNTNTNNIDNFTIGQIKEGLYVDFFDMCNELLLLDKFNYLNINYILSKNYRKIMLLVIILITIIITYLIINILDK